MPTRCSSNLLNGLALNAAYRETGLQTVSKVLPASLTVATAWSSVVGAGGSTPTLDLSIRSFLCYASIDRLSLCASYLQAAQVVLISLFELNTPEFTMLLGALPKTFQDGATKLLHGHLKNSSNTSSSVVSRERQNGAPVPYLPTILQLGKCQQVFFFCCFCKASSLSGISKQHDWPDAPAPQQQDQPSHISNKLFPWRALPKVGVSAVPPRVPI